MAKPSYLLLALTLGAGLAAGSDFSGDRAFEATKRAVSFGPRVAGSEASRRMHDWLERKLKGLGWSVEVDRFTAQTPHGPVAMSNVIARRGGLTGRVVAVSGHIDTKQFPFRFVGANDGGSSTGLLLELANALKDQRLRNDVWLVFFDGEEAFGQWSANDSLYGSRHLAAKWAQDGTLKRMLALINVDMIGDADLKIVDEEYSTPALRRNLRAAAAKLGYGAYIARQPFAIEDDHTPFLERGVNAIDLIDFDYGPANSWWHTTADTPERLSAKSLLITGKLVIEMVRMLEP